MKYLGLDYGTHNIGIAISDESGAFAFAREVIPANGKAASFISKIVRDERIGAIVMGDTRTSTGAPNPITAEAELFAKRLEQESGAPIMFVTEAWSSFEAARYAPDSHHDDSAAAAVILQRYIDMHASSGKVE